MASPQKENGFIAIANEIAGALSRINLSSYESRVLWIIFRKTYGWNKKEDVISLSQFKEETNIPIPHICRSLKKLTKKQIITQIGNGYHVTYSFQKNYDLWKPLPKQVTLPKQVMRITQTGNKPLPKQADTKYNKDTNTKYTIWVEDFFAYFLLKTKTKYKLTPERRDLIAFRLKEGHSVADLKRAVDNFMLDDWPDRGKHLDLIYCIGKQRGKPDSLEKWLNFTPSKPKPSSNGVVIV